MKSLCVFYFYAFYFCAPPFFSFSCNGKKFGTKTSRMLVFSWYLVREKELQEKFHELLRYEPI